MKWIIFTTVICFFASCSALRPADEIITLGDHKWVLTAIGHKPMMSTSEKAYLKFDEEELEVKGKAFCNSIGASYELMGKDQLTFDEFTSTKMYCEGVMNLESEMISNLREVKRYEIRNGMLYLYGSDKVLLTFKRK